MRKICSLAVVFVIIEIFASHCACDPIKHDARVLSRQRRFLSIWNTDEETTSEKPFVRYPQRVLHHYPIWRIHKYNGIDLKPMPVSLIQNLNQPIESSTLASEAQFDNVYENYRFPAAANANVASHVHPRQNTREEQNQLQQLAREIGITDVKNLPKMEEVMQLLGTSTEADTVEAVREIASTPEGVDMIKSFLRNERSIDQFNDLETLNLNDADVYVNEPIGEFSENRQNIVPSMPSPMEPPFRILPFEQPKAMPFRINENDVTMQNPPAQQPSVFRNEQQFDASVQNTQQSIPSITRIPVPQRVYSDPPRLRVPESLPHAVYGPPPTLVPEPLPPAVYGPPPTLVPEISTPVPTPESIPGIEEPSIPPNNFINVGNGNANIDIAGIQIPGAAGGESSSASITGESSSQNQTQGIHAVAHKPILPQSLLSLSGIPQKVDRLQTNVGLFKTLLPAILPNRDDSFLDKLKRFGYYFSFTSGPEIPLVSTTPIPVQFVRAGQHLPAETYYRQKAQSDAAEYPTRTHIRSRPIESIEIPRVPHLPGIQEIPGLKNLPDIPQIPKIHIQQSFPMSPQSQRQTQQGTYLRVKYPLNGFNPLPSHSMPERPFSYVASDPSSASIEQASSISSGRSIVPSPVLQSSLNSVIQASKNDFEIPGINHLPLEEDEVSMQAPITSFGTPAEQFNSEEVQNDRTAEEQSRFSASPNNSFQRRSSNLEPRRISPYDFYASGTIYRANPGAVDHSIPTVLQGRSMAHLFDSMPNTNRDSGDEQAVGENVSILTAKNSRGV